MSDPLARNRPARHLARAAWLAPVVLLALPGRPAAHEIPGDVTVQVLVKPGADRLRLLIRVPLEAMRDFDFPVTGPGYLDAEAARPLLDDAAQIWIADYMTAYEDGRPLPRPTVTATRVSLPSDRSFGRYEDALAHMAAEPLGAATHVPWRQILLDVALEIPTGSPRSRFSIDPGLSHLGLRTVTVLRFVTADGAERDFQFTGDPGVVRLDPRWHQAAWSFVRLGFLHILDGIDHLLFLLCLVIPFRRIRPLIVIVTSFTAAHSVTLIASAFGFAPGALWFPPLIETLIAASIVYMALENIVGAKLERRWLIAFGFGLVHGFGFSFALRETLQFAGSHLLVSLLSFNLGVELGQMFVLVLTVPLLGWVFRHVVSERMGTVILSALVAHQAWHWMTDRGGAFLAYGFRWPALDARFVAVLMRWAMLALVLVAALWALRGLYGRLLRAGPRPVPDRPPPQPG